LFNASFESFLPASMDVHDRVVDIHFSLIRYVIGPFSFVFADSEDETADPHIIFDELGDEAS
jgi:hypothetical protein